MAATFDHKFSSRTGAGVPIVLAGSPVISIYKDNSTTQTTVGVTLTTNFDGIVGCNNVRVDLSDAFYTVGSNFQMVVTTGTVDGISVVGAVVGSFSIEARSAVMSTVPGRTIDISAGGEVGVDWANVGSPTTTLNLSGTTIKTATDVESDTAVIGAGGSGLSAVPWNPAWDAEVESEVTDSMNIILSDSIPADGTLPTVRQALYMLVQFMVERSVTGTTVTVKKANGSTTLFTLTLDSATSPTSITRAT